MGTKGTIMKAQALAMAFAVPAILVGAIGLVVVQTEDGFIGHRSTSDVASTSGVALPAANADAAVADGATVTEPAAKPAAAAAPAKTAAKPASAALALQQYTNYQHQITGEVDNWWNSALHRAGLSYSGPRLVVAAPGKRVASHCGRAVASPKDDKKAYPAFYCRGDKTVYLSADWLYRSIYLNFHRGGVAAIVAHEYGHHIQHSIGIADPKVSRQELQADCLAGVWMRSAVASGELNAADVKDGRRALRALGDTKMTSKLHHGTPAERTNWFDRGYASGDAYRCNHF
jgi:predicted metalloprotease